VRNAEQDKVIFHHEGPVCVRRTGRHEEREEGSVSHAKNPKESNSEEKTVFAFLAFLSERKRAGEGKLWSVELGMGSSEQEAFSCKGLSVVAF